jgi:Domain of unknown function (DUF4328)/Protein of unknown function (DUF2510)
VYSYAAPRPWRDNRRFVAIACAIWISGIAVAGLIGLHEANRVADDLRHGRGESNSFGFVLGPLSSGSSGPGALLGLVNLAGTALVALATVRLAKAHALLGRPATTWGPGWAVAGRLIPFANAVIPALQLDELWRGSHPANRPNDPAWRDRPHSALGRLLLVAGVVSSAIATVTAIRFAVAAFRAIVDLAGAEEFEQRLADVIADTRPWRIATIVAALVTACLATRLLMQIADRQQRLYEADPASIGAPAVPVAAHPWQATFPPGWFADPWARYPLRWWDGVQWSPHVSVDGQATYDPIPLEQLPMSAPATVGAEPDPPPSGPQ